MCEAKMLLTELLELFNNKKIFSDCCCPTLDDEASITTDHVIIVFTII